MTTPNPPTPAASPGLTTYTPESTYAAIGKKARLISRRRNGKPPNEARTSPSHPDAPERNARNRGHTCGRPPPSEDGEGDSDSGGMGVDRSLIEASYGFVAGTISGGRAPGMVAGVRNCSS